MEQHISIHGMGKTLVGGDSNQNIPATAGNLYKYCKGRNKKICQR